MGAVDRQSPAFAIHQKEAGEMNMRRFLVRCLLLVASGIITLLVIEVILRISGFQINPLEVDVANANDARFYHIFEDRYFVYDPQFMWKPKAGYDVFNSQGFRGPELKNPKPEGEFRIFAIGDSNTLGYSGNFTEHWPGRLQELFNQGGSRTRVINAGVYGYTSYQGLLKLKQCLSYQPDLVLISFGSNDGHRVQSSDAEMAVSGISNRRLRQFLHRFKLGELVLLVSGRLVSPRASEPKARVSIEQYRSNLKSMIQIAREKRIGIVLLTRPYTGPVENQMNWKYFAHEYNAATVDMAIQERVPIIDVYSYFKTQDQLFADESHFNREGIQLAGKIIYDSLLPLIHP